MLISTVAAALLGATAPVTAADNHNLIDGGAVAMADSLHNEFADDGRFADLDDLVVTATRTPKSLKDVPVVTRLITADEIRKTDATNILDLLTEELPGLEFGYAMSQETSLNMSGFGGSAVLFLVDGERLAGETMDNVDYNRLNLNSAGQVEIVKGASSALYGANAVGGVVNIISSERTEPWHVNLNSKYSSEGHEWRAGGEVSFNTDKWNSSTTAQFNRKSTVQLASPFDTQSLIYQLYGGRTYNIKERLVFRALDNLKIVGRGGYFNRTSTRSTYTDHYYDWNGGLRGIWDISPKDFLELTYGYDQYDKVRYVGNTRTHDHDYTNRQNTLHGLYSHFWNIGTLTVGADYMYDWLSTYQFADNEHHSQYSLDAFAQFDWQPLSWLNVVAAVRDDYFSASKAGHATARIALMFKPKPLTVRASYAGGFRAPTLKEMYMNFDMAGMQMIYGNPNLKPEKSQNFNLSLERNGAIRSTVFEGAYSLTATGSYSYYSSRITTALVKLEAGETLRQKYPFLPSDIDMNETNTYYCNEDGVEVANFDVTFRYRMRCGVGVKASYNYLHTWGRSVDSQFVQPRPHSVTWRLDYEHAFPQLYKYFSLYAAYSGRYLSAPDLLSSSTQTQGAYSISKFTLELQVWRGVGVNFIIDNLFDYTPKHYYYNSPWTAGLSWSLGVNLDINDIFGK